MGFPLLLFFLCLVFGVFTHVAACLAAVLAVAAIRAGVFLEKDYFSHFLY